MSTHKSAGAMQDGEHFVRPRAAAARPQPLGACRRVPQQGRGGWEACGDPEDWAAARAMMEAGVDLMELDEDRFNAPLHWAAWHGRHTLARRGKKASRCLPGARLALPRCCGKAGECGRPPGSASGGEGRASLSAGGAVAWAPGGHQVPWLRL